MKKVLLLLGTIGAVTISSPSFADLRVQFIEGAPKDRFVITNVGECAMGAGRFEIDFVNSKAGLIFDVTGAGAGVEVFQPFEVTAGGQYLKAEPFIVDGDQRATLDMSGLGVGEVIAFTIDVDDTIGSRAITVTNSELGGTKFSLLSAGETFSVAIGAEPQATLATPKCDP